MMKNRYALMVLSLLVAMSTLSVSAQDPFAHIQYKQVFDQADIYKKYRKLMYKLGCADNVFKSEVQGDFGQQQVNEYSDDDDFITKHTTLRFDPVRDAAEFAAFQKECMNRLNNGRRMSILAPSLEGLSDLAFMGLVVGSYQAAAAYTPAMTTYFTSLQKYFSDKLFTSQQNNGPQVEPVVAPTQSNAQPGQQEFVLKDNSTQNAFAGALITSLFALKGLAGAGYNLMYWPDNTLESYENFFAKNKCFIPRALWEKITTEFMAARKDTANKILHTQFLDFALGFTAFKPKPTLTFKDGMSLMDVKIELNRRIDEFFGDYKNSIDISYIKINVSKFMDLLVQDKQSKVMQGPRYLYLYGSGGIGKTHFVQTLSEWIEELVPHSVQFEDIVINSPIDLEGSDEHPGVFLKALRNQLKHNKRASIIMLDEATWLNQLVSTSKRVFNGDRSKLSTEYFGKNMDGSSVSLQLPPMLIFVASNEGIQDPALESRFDTILYPMPSPQALVDYGINVAQHSQLLQQAHCPIDKDLIALWIEKIDEKQRNFRYIAGNVEALLLLSYQHAQKQVAAV